MREDGQNQFKLFGTIPLREIYLNDNTFKQIHIALTIPLKCKNGKH
jgi:hypothetical protein